MLTERWGSAEDSIGPELPPGTYQVVITNAVVKEGDKPKIVTTMLVVGGDETWIGTTHEFYDNMSTDKNIGFMKRKFKACGIEDVSVLSKCLAAYKNRKVAIVVTESGGFVNFRVDRLLKVLSKDDMNDVLKKYNKTGGGKQPAAAAATEPDDDPDGDGDAPQQAPAAPAPAAPAAPAGDRKMPTQEAIARMEPGDVEELLLALECDPKKCKSSPRDVAAFLVAVIEGDAYDPGIGVVKLAAKALGLKFDKNTNDSDVEKLIEASL